MRRGRAAGLAALAALLIVAVARGQVEQKPSLETTEGTGINITCTHTKKVSSDYIHFYCQLPGQAPEFLALTARGSKPLPTIAGQLSVSEDGRSSSLWLAEPRRGGRGRVLLRAGGHGQRSRGCGRARTAAGGAGRGQQGALPLRPPGSRGASGTGTDTGNGIGTGTDTGTATDTHSDTNTDTDTWLTYWLTVGMESSRTIQQNPPGCFLPICLKTGQLPARTGAWSCFSPAAGHCPSVQKEETRVPYCPPTGTSSFPLSPSKCSYGLGSLSQISAPCTEITSPVGHQRPSEPGHLLGCPRLPCNVYSICHLLSSFHWAVFFVFSTIQSSLQEISSVHGQ
ncbi:uncharacterized protein GJ701_015401 isoform 2-T3 [Geothlypis trichas]